MNYLNVPVDFPVDEITDALAENLTPVIYRAGAYIFREDEPGGYAYVIERGEVNITKAVDDGEIIIATLGPGELLGEMSPIDNQRRSASARAISETEVIPISRGQFSEVINNADPLIQLLLNVLLDRLRSVNADAGPQPDGLHMFDRDLKSESIEAIRGRAIGQIKAETELRDAFARRELDLFYQPIVDMENTRLAGFEALLRWLSPDKGIIGPDQFIGVAEESGLIVPIGLWVIEHACHMLTRFQTLRDRHFPDAPPLFITANVSARQLRTTHQVDAIIATIRRTGIDPTALKIEITEGLLLDDPEGAIKAFTRLKALGVHIALDDFGTGYSSLSYLHRFPLDTLKIDRSFVTSMLKSRDSMTVISTITRLARDLKLNCVSEGIEDPHELAKLRDFDCDYGQGYLFSKPVPESEVAALIARDILWTPGGNDDAAELSAAVAGDGDA